MFLTLRFCFAIFLLLDVQSGVNPGSQQEASLLLKARDENGAPVESAKVYLYAEGARLVATWETDFTGRVAMTGIAPGLYQIRAEKRGFYSARLERVEVGRDESLEIVLAHELEIRESVEVMSSPPAIDLTRT